MASIHRTSLALLATIVASSAGAQAKRPMTFNDVMDLKNVGTVALSPDGSTIAYTVSGWEHPNARPADPTKPDTAKGDRHDVRSHIWLVSTSGGAPRQLTFSERGESSPQWSPDGKTLAFLSARGTGTDVKTQIWLLPMDGGEAAQLTSSRESVTGFSWSRDGSKIAFLAVDTLPKGDEANLDKISVPHVEGCVADPCKMGFPPNDIRVVANKKMLDDNPAVRKLFEVAAIPLEDFSAQNARMNAGEDKDSDIVRQAAEWIAAHQALYDGWLKAAKAAAAP